jgi:opacity protein-like surface antigen/outer membrane protein OmpA-like peptidoglycan-associated protein
MAIMVFMAPVHLLHGQSAAQPEHRYNYTPRVELFLGYTHFGTSSTDTTVGNRMVGLNGGSTSLALNLNRYVGLVADVGGYDANRLQLTGTGTNQPLVVDASGTVYSYLFGPRISFRNSTRVTPFAQALFGGVHASDVTASNCAGSGCTPLTAQSAFAMTAGGGLDIGLSRHFSIRAVQAEYMMTRFSDINTGAGASQNDLRLSSGLVFRFGDIAPSLPVQLACAIQPATAFPGDPVTVIATATNLNLKSKVTYSWSTNGGTISGSDSTVTINTAGIAPGTFAVNGHVALGSHMRQQASCTASFTLQPFAPPSIACEVNPTLVNIGDTATIRAQAVSPQNRTLTYSYSTTAGAVTGSTPTATLATSGVAPGTITISCNVVDDLGKTATATTNVTVLAPPQPVAPETRNLCAITFNRDSKRPVRVDNEAKGCLDDVALGMHHESAGRLVIVGNYASDEKPQAGAKRAQNVRQYLIDEKGIDASRIDVRVGSDSGRTVTNVFVPAGATFAVDGSTPIDSSVH